MKDLINNRNFFSWAFAFLVLFALSISFVQPPNTYGADAKHDPNTHDKDELKKEDPTCPPDEPCQDEAGDPVLLATGDFQYKHRDLFIPGRLPLTIKRGYHSQNKYDGPFGYGWNFNYNMTLAETVSGEELTMADGSTCVPKKIIVRRGNGVRLRFKSIDCQMVTFQAPTGRFLTLERTGNTYTMTSRRNTRYVLGLNGAIQSITDAYGNQLTMTYAIDGKLSTVSDSGGRTLQFSYGSNNKITTITDPAGRVFGYAYDGDNNLVAYTNPLGHTTRYAYDLAHNLISITDPLGQTRLSLVYDSEERVVREEQNGGAWLFSYDTINNITTVTNRRGVVSKHYMNDTGNLIKLVHDFGGLNLTTLKSYDQDLNLNSKVDSNGNQTQYGYNAQGQTTSIIDALGGETTVTYNSFNKITSITDALNQKTQYDYDAMGNMIRRTNALNNSTTFTYSPNGDLTGITNALGQGGSYTYDSYGNKITSTDASTHTAHFTYDILGNLTSAKDKNGNITLYDYDLLNRRLKVTNALGGVTRYTYNENGKLTSIIDALNNTSTLSYNSYNQLVSVTDALGNTASLSYDLNGNIVSVTDPRGNSTTFDYDAANRLVKVTDALANSTDYSYDANGNKTQQTDAMGNSTAYLYDALNRLVKTTDAQGNFTNYDYDAKGNLSRRTDREGRFIDYLYDPLNRVISAKNSLGAENRFVFDIVGKLTGLIDPNGNTTTKEYDPMNRLTKTIYADNSFETYTRDAVGNKLTKTDRMGQTTTYTYDSLNRLVKKSFPDLSQVTYNYDVVGRLITAANSSSTVSFDYDAAGRVVQAIQDTISIGYEYDSAGNRTRLTYPDSSIYNYTYDSLNRLQQVLDSAGLLVAEYTYNQVGRRSSLSLANDTEAIYQYDTLNRLTSLTNQVTSSQAPLSAFGYDLNKIGKRTQVTTPQGNHTYSYDTAHRLTGVAYPTGSPFADTTFALDDAGNRISATDSVSTLYTTNNMNQYSNKGATQYSYDANGNMTDDGVNAYTYDFENRLVQAVTPTGTISYAYDPLGRSLSKTDGSGTVRYVNDFSRVIAEADGAGNMHVSFVYGSRIDEVLAMNRGNKTYFYHRDSLGSTTQITDAAGSTVESYQYGAFGQTAILGTVGGPLSASAIGNPYMFTGRRIEPESGLYYYRARYYHPDTAKFTSADPIGYRGGMNLYAYASHDPINLKDPFGLQSIGDMVIKKEIDDYFSSQRLKRKKSNNQNSIHDELWGKIKNSFLDEALDARGSYQYFGDANLNSGDVDGDGYADFATGGYGNNYSGSVYESFKDNNAIHSTDRYHPRVFDNMEVFIDYGCDSGESLEDLKDEAACQNMSFIGLGYCPEKENNTIYIIENPGALEKDTFFSDDGGFDPSAQPPSIQNDNIDKSLSPDIDINGNPIEGPIDSVIPELDPNIVPLC